MDRQVCMCGPACHRHYNGHHRVIIAAIAVAIVSRIVVGSAIAIVVGIVGIQLLGYMVIDIAVCGHGGLQPW